MCGLKKFKSINIFPRGAGLSIAQSGRLHLAPLLFLVLCLVAWPSIRLAAQDQGAQDQSAPPPPPMMGPDQLEQLVAPIALYPDSLVSQILAASTYPEQVVEADRWLMASPGLDGPALGQAVDQQPWDPSIKALTGFPSILGNMDKNLSWTSTLGDAYYNQPADVMEAIQAMRQKAEAAGNLQSDPEELVSTQDSNIDIDPTDPDDVYVPEYDPWLAYGDPIVAWPGWYAYPGIWFGGPRLHFGTHFGIGYLGGYGWGWHHWGMDWHGRAVLFDHNRFLSHGTAFYSRDGFHGGDAHGFRPGAPQAGEFNHPFANARPFNGDPRAARGYADPHTQSTQRSGAFSGYNHGGEERGYSSRGSASFGGGGRR